jgi:hypothetical protein
MNDSETHHVEKNGTTDLLKSGGARSGKRPEIGADYGGTVGMGQITAKIAGCGGPSESFLKICGSDTDAVFGMACVFKVFYCDFIK